MRVITKTASMQRLALQWKRIGVCVVFVPTMGYLHEGHLRLIRRARQLAGPSGMVVVSIYVNPTQFGPGEDFNRYPRDLARDKSLCRREGVNVVFAPDDRQMYPPRPRGRYSTFVVEEELTATMEGRCRPGHFRGVTTVVAKLFHLVLPDVAVFGAKDYQQAAVVRRMIEDLNFPVKLVVAPTVREPDGLAMSSRNSYLSPELRLEARALWEAICEARRTVRASRRPIPAARLRQRLQRLIESRPHAQVEYIEFFEPTTLQPVKQVGRGHHMALAVFIGKTRLIDNARL